MSVHSSLTNMTRVGAHQLQLSHYTDKSGRQRRGTRHVHTHKRATAHSFGQRAHPMTGLDQRCVSRTWLRRVDDGQVALLNIYSIAMGSRSVLAILWESCPQSLLSVAVLCVKRNTGRFFSMATACLCLVGPLHTARLLPQHMPVTYHVRSFCLPLWVCSITDRVVSRPGAAEGQTTCAGVTVFSAVSYLLFACSQWRVRKWEVTAMVCAGMVCAGMCTCLSQSSHRGGPGTL